MRNRKWKLVIALAVGIALVSAGLFFVHFEVNTKAIPDFERDVYVYDSARIVSREDEDTLNSLLRELQNETDANFYVITMKSHKKLDLDTYATKVFSAWGLERAEGYGEENVIVCFSKNDKEFVVKSTSGLSEVIDEATISGVANKYYRPYVDKKHSEAIEGTATSFALVVSAHYDANVTNLRFSGPYNGNPYVEFAIIFGGLIVCLLILIFCFKDNNKSIRARKRNNKIH